MIPELLWTTIFLQTALTSELSVLTNMYIRCCDNDLYVGSVLDTVIVRSTLHCAAVCSWNDRCQEINICPSDGTLGMVDCNLHGDSNLQDGNSLKYDISQDCLRMKKIADPTASMWCENGGTLENGRCRCPAQFAGTTCQRLIRDCTEAYDNGYRLDNPGLPFLIQPLGITKPFWMVCILEWNGVSYVLMRNRMISLNANWTTAKTWIGDDLSVKLYDVDYFIGLENLYHLLRQAEYQANLFCIYNNSNSRGWIYYSNISIGPEDSSYALSYANALPEKEYLDNGFSKNAPVVFSTQDHDPNSCNHSYPGWYDSDCGGYSLFADKVVWPVGGLDRNINILNIALTRVSNFVDN